MELWLDLRDAGEPPGWCEDFDHIFHGNDEDSISVGAHITIDSDAGQSAAMAAIGSVEWLLVECSDWEMIPVENLVAAAQSTPTRIAVAVNARESVLGIAFALDRGVDALLVTPQRELWQAALSARAMRDEREQNPIRQQPQPCEISLQRCTVTNVESFGTGDRVCVDLTRMLKVGQGMLIGSQAGQLALVHGETIESEYVPTRPFRVNAGAVHSYILLADSTTKYLSELTSGDAVMLVDVAGAEDSAVVGRVKLEHRPLVRIGWSDANGESGQVVLQQAETARLMRSNGTPLSVTNVIIGDEIIADCRSVTRHLGQQVSISSNEY